MGVGAAALEAKLTRIVDPESLEHYLLGVIDRRKRSSISAGSVVNSIVIKYRAKRLQSAPDGPGLPLASAQTWTLSDRPSCNPLVFRVPNRRKQQRERALDALLLQRFALVRAKFVTTKWALAVSTAKTRASSRLVRRS